MPKPSPLRKNLKKLVDETVQVEPTSLGHEESAIGFFDLVGSTRRKIDEGHRSGTVAALQHNAVCGRIGSEFAGTVIKSLGDGVLMTFSSSRNAILAALNITVGLNRFTDLQTKIGLTVGSIEHIEVLNLPDIAGAAVDRCARLQATAEAGEIVVDEPFFQSVQTHLSDFASIVIGEWEAEALKGIGSVRIRRLSLTMTA
jgi:class 3 adenylate cyclase